ncbi:MAG: spore coat protein CotJB [Peptococcaceae bacterium]|nr:spore coat protein CotJB [Peptococcaceae bacterium]
MKKYNTSPAARTRETALLELQQLSFSLVDLNLYLDTHPDCQQESAIITSCSSSTGKQKPASRCCMGR